MIVFSAGILLKLIAHNHIELFFLYKLFIVRPRDVISRVPAFQPDGPCSIPGGVRNFNSYPGTGYVLCVLSCVVSGGGPDIVLTTHSELVYLSSVMVYSLLLPLQASDPRAFWVVSSGGCKSYIGGG